MKLSQNQLKALIGFKNFVSKRNKISLVLSLVILVCYYIFILGVGLAPEVLGYRLGPSSITLGIIVGVFLIVLSVVATGLYTFLANSYFDKDQDEILRELEESDVIKPLQNGEIDYKNFTESSIANGGGE
ncbi:DUF485 domain-containing protein [Helicobacter magdeburgensis]|uniref:DUF485 domain-containing protein n=1 Tax=Helicobacter magdeburgensis TaxID=471858 RepID=A0A4U8SYF3_9HELI|nr:DUF485 domain-containing protein [Helicobacter magdeburgensis]TLD92065.1 DUF485 domain-containing protein [Helicobacter magdeburgensis]